MSLQKILITLSVITPVAAIAGPSGTYGTVGGCNYLFGAGGPLAEGLDNTDRPDYFDGQKLGGLDWWCDISGSCDSDGGPFTVSVSAVTEEAEATLTIDGATFTLPRCPEVPAS